MPYSLKSLVKATGIPNAPYSLKAANGGSAVTTKVSDFFLNYVTIPSTNKTDVAFGDTFSITGNIGTGGIYLYRIANNSSNYTFTPYIAGTGTLASVSLQSSSTYYRTYRNDHNPQGTGCNSIQTITTQFIYNDNLNFPAQNFNTPLYSPNIRLYSPPAPSLSFVSSTQPPRPCQGAWPCLGATITLNYNMGSFGGVNGSTGNLYMSTNGSLGSVIATFLNNTGSYTIYNLYGNTKYYLTLVNRYNCYSTTLQITTPSYI